MVRTKFLALEFVFCQILLSILIQQNQLSIVPEAIRKVFSHPKACFVPGLPATVFNFYARSTELQTIAAHPTLFPAIPEMLLRHAPRTCYHHRVLLDQKSPLLCFHRTVMTLWEMAPERSEFFFVLSHVVSLIGNGVSNNRNWAFVLVVLRCPEIKEKANQDWGAANKWLDIESHYLDNASMNNLRLSSKVR